MVDFDPIMLSLQEYPDLCNAISIGKGSYTVDSMCLQNREGELFFDRTQFQSTPVFSELNFVVALVGKHPPPYVQGVKATADHFKGFTSWHTVPLLSWHQPLPIYTADLRA